MVEQLFDFKDRSETIREKTIKIDEIYEFLNLNKRKQRAMSEFIFTSTILEKDGLISWYELGVMLSKFEFVEPILKNLLVEYHRKIEVFYIDMFLWIKNYNALSKPTSEDANLYGEYMKDENADEMRMLEAKAKELNFYKTMFK